MKTRQLCVRLRALGIPKQQADQIISLVTKWTSCSGPEWTVNRLKSLKLEYVTRLAGKPVLAPNFSRNREGLPKGVWSWLLKQRSKRACFKVINTLMVYSSLTSPEITLQQREKFFGSMESRDQTGLHSRLKNIRRIRVTEPLNSKPFLLECVSPEKSAPSCLGPSISKADSLGQLVYFSQSVPSVEAYFRYPQVFKPVVPEALFRHLQGTLSWHLDIPQRLEAVESIGKIGFIQEPGYKLRAVANPNAVWQAALAPLKKLILTDLERNFPTDCTHDQMSGILDIQAWLRQGKECYSVDLSDATNLMPRSLQMDVLRTRYLFTWPDNISSRVPFLGPFSHYGSSRKQQQFSELVDAFEFASAAKWYYRETDGSLRTARFTRGQPLGLGPSFPTFALTHNIILEGLCEKVGCKPVNTFRVLGDDVVISDGEVHRLYRETLKNLGCKVSESKTIQSTVLAEFAGRVITSDHIIPAYKWRRVLGENFLDIAKNYGMQSRRLLSREQRLIVDLISEVPEEIGGFGWNPKGKPLSARLQTPAAQWLLQRTPTSPHGVVVARYRTLTSLRHQFARMVSTSSYIPIYEKETIGQQLAMGMLSSSRAGVLSFWDNSLILKDEELEEVRRQRRLPEPRFVDRVIQPGESVHSVWDDQYGYLIPYGVSKSGDPRSLSASQIVKISELVEEVYSLSSTRALKAVSKAFAREQRGATRPSFEGLVNAVEHVAKVPDLNLNKGRTLR